MRFTIYCSKISLHIVLRTQYVSEYPFILHKVYYNLQITDINEIAVFLFLVIIVDTFNRIKLL